jgi:DNA-binding transcriptional regulator YdaS (Cro superfamily)
MMKQLTALERAIELTGGSQARFAMALSFHVGRRVPQQTVSNWLVRSAGRVPAEFCLAIELATSGQVVRSDLRPDIFMEENNGKGKRGSVAATKRRDHKRRAES